MLVIAFDWCEIRGTSFDKWRQALAAAAGTDASHVSVTSTHVHDAPVMDEDAEKLLRDMERTGVWQALPPPPAAAPVQVAAVCQPAFNEECMAKVAAAVCESLSRAERITHLGAGRAQVERMAGNRRFLTRAQRLAFSRTSRSTDEEAQLVEEGTIDPWLRTLSAWNGERALCAIHNYAVHPMSTYGADTVSADFPGAARAAMQQAHPEALQIYTTRCAGNITAGKYNCGTAEGKARLVERLRVAMEAAWQGTERTPLNQVGFCLVYMPLGARQTPPHTEALLHQRLVVWYVQGRPQFDKCEIPLIFGTH